MLLGGFLPALRELLASLVPHGSSLEVAIAIGLLFLSLACLGGLFSRGLVWWSAGWGPVELGTRRFERRRAAAPHSYRTRAEAERRAERLLRDVLGPEEFALFQRRGYLTVRSPSFAHRVYLVPERQGPVTVCEFGKPVMRLCVQCVERVPDLDTVVMHKLMIEGNEREYLRIANRV